MEKKKLARLLISFLISIFVILVLQMPNPWLDILELGIKNGVIFGKDTFYTYGPLSFFLAGTGAHAPLFPLLLFDLFVVVCLTFIFYRIFSNVDIGLAIRVLIISLTLMANGVSIPLLLFWLMLFLFLDYGDLRNDLGLLSALLIAVIILYIQVDIGIMAACILAFFLLYYVVTGAIDVKRIIASIIFYVGAVVLLSYPLKTALFAYLQNGFSILNAYGDSAALKLRQTHWTEITISIGCFVVLINYFFVQGKELIRNGRSRLICLTIFVCMYFLFKNGFADVLENHFFEYTIPLASLFVLFLPEALRHKAFYYVLIPIAFLTLVERSWHGDLLKHISKTWSPQAIGGRYRASGVEVDLTGKVVSSFIGPGILRAISGKTVDIIQPSAFTSSNDSIDYSSRPVPSQLVVNWKLDEMNAKFIDEKGAEILLVKNYTSQDRNLLFDEPALTLGVLRNYKVNATMSTWHWLVLERRARSVAYSNEIIEEEKFSWDDDLKVESSDDLQLIYPRIKYSFLGEVFRFVFWAPEVSISLRLNDGTVKTYRYNNAVASGLVVNKFVDPRSREDFKLFADHWGRLNVSVQSVRFTSPSRWAFNGTFYVRSELIKFSEAEQPLDKAVFPREIGLDSSNEPKLSVRTNVESFVIDRTRLDFFGWSVINDPSYSSLRVVPLLQSESHSVIFPSMQNFERTDVQRAFEYRVSPIAGFGGTIFRDFLKQEAYHFGVAFLDGDQVVKREIGPLVLDNRVPSILGAKSSFLLEEFSVSAKDKPDALVNNVESFTSNEHAVEVSGWAAASDKSTVRAEPVKVLLKSKDGKMFAAATRVVYRADVSSYLKNEIMDSTGFESSFGIDSIPRGYYELGLLVAKKDKTSRYQFLREVTVGFPEEFVLKRFEGPIEESDFNIEFDYVRDSTSRVSITGWAAAKERGSRNCTISILLNSDDGVIYISPTMRKYRPDVTSYFENKYELDNSGFEAIISKRKLGEGKYRLGLLLTYEDTNESLVKFTDWFIEK